MSRKDWSSEKIFFRLLNNKSSRTYWDNISELRRRPDKEVFEKALQLSKSSTEKEKIIGIDVLAQLGFNPRFNQQKTLRLYFDLLEEELTDNVLISILYGISHNNENLTQNQVKTLVIFKVSKNAVVRQALVNSLSGIEDEVAVDALIQLSKDKDSSVRDWATFGLGSQIEISNDKIINALWERVEDDYTNVRYEAIAGLAARKDKKIKDIIIRELEEIDDQGSLVLESIELLNDKGFIELLELQIEKNKQTQKVNEKWLLDCIEKLKL